MSRHRPWSPRRDMAVAMVPLDPSNLRAEAQPPGLIAWSAVALPPRYRRAEGAARVGVRGAAPAGGLGVLDPQRRPARAPGAKRLQRGPCCPPPPTVVRNISGRNLVV